MMRVIVISSRHHAGQGGIGACIGALVRAASAAGWHVELITRPSEHLPPAAKVHAVRTVDDEDAFQMRVAGLRRIERIRPYRYGLWALAAAERLLECDADVDAVLTVDAQAEGLVAIHSDEVRRRFEGVPFIVAAHGPMHVVETLAGRDPRRFGRSIYHRWERAALGRADGVTGLSELLLGAIGPVERGVAIPPIVDAETRPWRAARAPEILLIGDIAAHKGVDVWARSLNRVFRQVKDVRAVLIGPDTAEGPDGTSMAAHAAGLIEARHRGRFEWRGSLAHEQVLEAIEQAALVVAPSRFDSFSRVAAETLQCGQPLVVSEQVGIGEWVDGLATVPAGQVEALADRQREVLQASPAWRDAARDQYERLREVASAARVLGAYEAFIGSMQVRSDAAGPGAGEDAMETMRRFLGEVEREERATAPSLPGGTIVGRGDEAPMFEGNFTGR